MKIKRHAVKLMREILKASEPKKAAIIERINTDASSLKAMEYLEAKQLIRVDRAWGGSVLDLSPLADGLTYFQDRSDHRTERWIDRGIGFVCGVASTVLAHFLIQAIQAYIG